MDRTRDSITKIALHRRYKPYCPPIFSGEVHYAHMADEYRCRSVPLFSIFAAYDKLQSADDRQILPKFLHGAQHLLGISDCH